VLAWSLTADQRKEAAQVILDLDVSQSGRIKLVDLRASLSSSACSAQASEADALLSVVSVGSDEVLFSELTAVLASSNTVGDQLQRDDVGTLREAFRRFSTADCGAEIAAIKANSSEHEELPRSFEDFMAILWPAAPIESQAGRQGRQERDGRARATRGRPTSAQLRRFLVRSCNAGASASKRKFDHGRLYSRRIRPRLGVSQ